MTARPAKIALVGFGTIGTGVARLLLSHQQRISQRAGREVELARIVDIDTNTPRNCVVPDGVLTDDIRTVFDDPEIETVVQLIGGVGTAREVMIELLRAGKNVVTANKALLAQHGPEIFEVARAARRSVAFEAAVAGGIPIINAIGQSLAANRFDAIQGILNGTCNFIVSEMEQHGSDYATVLAEAQRLGFAEADPTLDVNGADAAQKLAILAQLTFGAQVDWEQIPCAGIDNLDPFETRYASELGYRIRLIASARRGEHGLELSVAPTLVRQGTPLAEVRGAYNAIGLLGDYVGFSFYEGLGAGERPTASAVVADVIDTVVGRSALTFEALSLWGEDRPALEPSPVEKTLGRYYLRLTVEDCPGVLAGIAAILGEHNISISSLVQHEPNGDAQALGGVPLIIMTYSATEGDMCDALEKIDALDTTLAETVRMRVLEDILTT